MQFQISRNGQMYGPYTLEDLQRYVASGNVLVTDLAKSDEMAEWVPVSSLLGATAPTSTPAFSTPMFGSSPEPTSAVVNEYPDAPNLHWGLVLLFTVLTCGLFALVWELVVNAWLKKVQPNANSLYYYIAYVGVSLMYFVVVFIAAASHQMNQPNPLKSVLYLALIVLGLVARYSERSSLEEHFNGPEPYGLGLSGVMTFFFSTYYFQYHLNRINELKRSARLGAYPY
jgi:hypothetical protein